MTHNLKKYGLMIIAAVMLVALAFAGAASAATVTTEDGLRTAVAAGGTVKLGADINLTSNGGGSLSITEHDVTLDLNGHRLSAKYDNVRDKFTVISIDSGKTLRLKDSNPVTSHYFIYLPKSDPWKWVGDEIPELQQGDKLVDLDEFNLKEAMEMPAESHYYIRITGGIISTVYAYDTSFLSLLGDSVVKIEGKGKFVMDAGNIVGGSSSCGAGVCLDSGTFTMNGGNIAGSCANYATGGGVGVTNDSTFTMNGGNIVGCSAPYHGKGGGVYVAGSDNGKIARFIMNSGSCITDCQSFDGSGVSVVADGEFIMNGGTITKCLSSSLGAGVFVEGDNGEGNEEKPGRFTMNDGTISYCSADVPARDVAEHSGGGVYVSTYGEFTMIDGSIIGCKALDCSGGVYIAGDVEGTGVKPGEFIMKGGTISGCTAGMASAVMSVGVFTMSGGTIEKNPGEMMPGVLFVGPSTINGTAVISADNEAMLMSLTGEPFSILVTTPFTGSVQCISLYPYDEEVWPPVMDPELWEGEVVVTNGGTVPLPLVQFKLSPAVIDMGYHLGIRGDDLRLVNSTEHDYAVSVIQPEHGTVSAFQHGSSEGTPITVTTEPDTGYHLDRVFYIKSGETEEHPITGGTFNLPASDVTVSAVFVKDPEPEVPSHGHSPSLPKDYTPSGYVEPMVQETAQPTAAPTPAAPTMMPTTTKPTSSTSKSPAPFIGLVLGLGAATLLIRMRR